MKMKKRLWMIGILFIFSLAGFTIYLLYEYNYIPHKKYTNEDFHIQTYISSVDQDNDGIDDQTDILESVRKYIETKPKYKSKYYESGYPDDEYGVCTDVVAFGLLGAGYDLMKLVNEDYNIDVVDERIDFRRVANLNIFFENHGISLTTGVDDIETWQEGDIVIFENHIGIVSDKRNKHGVPFIIHHGSPYQRYYEEDLLEKRDDIVGHFRISE